MVVPITESSSIRTPKSMLKNDSLQQERQISVDPISVKESVFKEGGHNNPSLRLPHLKPGKFLSASLPGSATSSPRFSSPLKKKWNNHSPIQQPSSSPLAPAMIDPITGQQSLALSRLAQLQEIHLKRSKSCGEGRNTSSSIDLEMCTRKLNMKSGSSHDDVEYSMDRVNSNNTREDPRKGSMRNIEGPEKFKCGACLFLPGFGKAKPVRSQNKDDEDISIGMRKPVVIRNEKQAMMTISKRVSLEKFECGSWRTSGIVMDGEDDITDGDNLFFDLPMELIRNDSRDDNESPVATAFVFDGDLKGVLKKTVVGTGTDNRKSVRFSDASPSVCVLPQSRKGRDGFNAYLEVQTV